MLSLQMLRNAFPSHTGSASEVTCCTYVLDFVAPGNAFSGRVTVAEGDCLAPLSNQGPVVRGLVKLILD